MKTRDKQSKQVSSAEQLVEKIRETSQGWQSVKSLLEFITEKLSPEAIYDFFLCQHFKSYIILFSSPSYSQCYTALLEKLDQKNIDKFLFSIVDYSEANTILHITAEKNLTGFYTLFKYASLETIFEVLSKKNQQGRTPLSIAFNGKPEVTKFSNYREYFLSISNLCFEVDERQIRKIWKDTLEKIKKEKRSPISPIDDLVIPKISAMFLTSYLDFLMGHNVAMNKNLAKDLITMYSEYFTSGYEYLGDFYADGHHVAGINLNLAIDYYETAYEKYSAEQDKANVTDKMEKLLNIAEKKSSKAKQIKHFLKYAASSQAIVNADIAIKQAECAKTQSLKKAEYAKAKSLLETAAEAGNQKALLKLGDLYYSGYYGNHFDAQGNETTEIKNSTPRLSIAIKYYLATIIAVMSNENPYLNTSNQATAQDAKNKLFNIALQKDGFGRYSDEAAKIFCKYADPEQDIESFRKLAALNYETARQKVEEYDSRHPGFFARLSTTYWKNQPLAYYETSGRHGDTNALSELFQYYREKKSPITHLINVMKMIADKKVDDAAITLIAYHLIYCIQELRNDFDLRQNKEMQKSAELLLKKFNSKDIAENPAFEDLHNLLNEVMFAKPGEYKKKNIDDATSSSSFEPSAPPAVFLTSTTDYEANPENIDTFNTNTHTSHRSIATGGDAYRELMQNEEPEEEAQEMQQTSSSSQSTYLASPGSEDTSSQAQVVERFFKKLEETTPASSTSDNKSSALRSLSVFQPTSQEGSERMRSEKTTNSDLSTLPSTPKEEPENTQEDNTTNSDLSALPSTPKEEPGKKKSNKRETRSPENRMLRTLG